MNPSVNSGRSGKTGSETPPAEMSRLAVRVGEAARLLDIGRSKAYELIQRGELPVIKVGSSLRVPLKALHAWIERQGTQGGSDGSANQR